ncbi:MAG: hypothetical protein MI919_07485 [Holophagales bacterium]|nr:hypothetical protein [Holophagales bacterium]
MKRAVDVFQASRAGFSDYLLGYEARELGADCTYSFDRALRGAEGFRVLGSGS